MPTATSSPVAGRTKEAIAATRKSDRADLVDGDDPPAEIATAAQEQPAGADLPHRQESGDQEQQAADQVRRPDEPVLGGGAEPADERVGDVDREDDRAEEEGEGAHPLEATRLARPPVPLPGQQPAVLPHLTRPVDSLQDGGVAAGGEADPTGKVDRAVEVLCRPQLRQCRADRKQRAAENEGRRRDGVEAAQAPGRVASPPRRSPRRARRRRGAAGRACAGPAGRRARLLCHSEVLGRSARFSGRDELRGIGAEAPAGVDRRELGHLLRGELEVEDARCSPGSAPG